MPKLDRLTDNKGFTFMEVIVASIIIAFVAAGVWGVYWSVVNTYYVEQKGVHLQAEGERILDLIANGGYWKDKDTGIDYRIYGLNSSIFYDDGTYTYPRVGMREEGAGNSHFTTNFDDDCDYDEGCDYRVAFCLDDVNSNRRFAEFAVKFTRTHPIPDNCNSEICDTYSTAKLYFRLTNPDDTSNDYEVLITENLLYRTESENFQNYNKTWFKAHLLPDNPSGDYYSGIKISFYLVDYPTEAEEGDEEGRYHTIKYNKNLERDVDPPISDSDQRRSFMGGIPYPKYFSTTIYFPNRL